MEGSNHNSGYGSPAPFLTKTYDMVEDPVTDSIVSWSHSGHSFVVWNPPEFARDLLPTYFKHNNFSSFVRQLNTYGFRKIDPDQWEFANEEFIRGQRHLLPKIHRRKPIHSHSLQPQGVSNPLTDSERQEFEEEIRKLKHEKSLLQLELQRHKQESQEFEIQVDSLGERLKNIEHRQRQTITFLAQLLKNSSSSSAVTQQFENSNKKRRLAVSSYLYDEANTGRNQLSAFQRENQETMSISILSLKLVETLDASLRFWESFVHGVGLSSGDEMHDFGVLQEPSPIIVTEMDASSEDSDVNIQQFAPNFHPSSPHSRDIRSSPELAVSSDHADSPAIESIYVSLDYRPKPSGIDVNAKPANAPDLDALDERVAENTTPTAGVNDVFWEQFLTETPRSSGTQEIHSERREMDDRNNEAALEVRHKFWWSMNNVDNLTEQMVHLTPAERI